MTVTMGPIKKTSNPAKQSKVKKVKTKKPANAKMIKSAKPKKATTMPPNPHGQMHQRPTGQIVCPPPPQPVQKRVVVGGKVTLVSVSVPVVGTIAKEKAPKEKKEKKRKELSRGELKRVREMLANYEELNKIRALLDDFLIVEERKKAARAL
jgi:hypothetical protein